MSKSYRKSLGFTNGSKLKDFMSAKDITAINWSLIDLYNHRLIQIFTTIQKTLTDQSVNIPFVVENAHTIFKSNDILCKLNNHGRSPESVYFSWMRGYLTAILFQSFIEKELNCTLIQNGADDLSNPNTFKRKSDPDFVDHEKKIFVEVQSGFKGGKIDIKKTKINPKEKNYEYYIVCIDCYNGQYCILNARDLLNIPESEWYQNEEWEGALCYTVPNHYMKDYSELV